MTNEEYSNIIIKYEKLVFTICYQIIGDYYEAQNLAQETFISAYTHIDNCKMENLKPWLARIATNKAKDFLKSAYIRKVKLDNEYNDTVISKELSPDDIYIENEKEEVIKEKIYSLKEPYLKVSIMYFIEERNVDEISSFLKRPKKTVQTQILRAKIMLQKILKEGLKYERTF